MSLRDARLPVTISGTIWRRGRQSLVLHPRVIVVTMLLLAFTLVCSVVAMTIGSYRVEVAEIVRILLGRSEGGVAERIILHIRLPRVVTGIFAGAALAVSGAIFQSVSRNALGSPDVIGFTTGAAAGAIAAIILFGAGPLQIALAAVLSGLLTATAVYLLSRKGRTTGGYRLVLVGIGVGAVLSAFNGLLLVMGNIDSAVNANLWLAGSLNARTWDHALPTVIGSLLLLPVVMLFARRLTLIEMGDDLARQLGVPVERVRLITMLVGVLLAALAVGAVGPIAFVALAAPQLAARLTGQATVPVLSAAATGASLMVLADVLSQAIPGNLVLPIGRMTGLVGGIYLIWLLTRSKQV